MELNPVGLASAAATFFGVWLGHVSVRRIEREVERLWIPSMLALLLGITLEIFSLVAGSTAGSAFCAILGVTLLWDAHEFYRQQHRVQNGRAPANPQNPRHAQILATYPTATTNDWLDREPCGSPVSTDDLLELEGQAR